MDRLAVRFHEICKNFPGVKALSEVSFDIKEGEVHALLGENGAGKSTLIKILAGVLHQDSGEMTFHGSPFTPRGPLDALRHGVISIYQDLDVFPNLSVAENLFLGSRQTTSPAGIYSRASARIATHKLFESLDIKIDPFSTMEDLGLGQRQMVVIARAISRDASLFIMDEPTAPLSDIEIEVLFRVIRDLRSKGKTVIYISHRLEEIFEVADSVTVLRDGRVITTLPISQADKETLVELMAGRKISTYYPKEAVTPGETVLKVRGLMRRNRFHGISFELKAGEVLGFAGLVGSGRSDVAKALFGTERIDQGTIEFMGESFSPKSPMKAISKGMGLVPENRREEGLVLSMTLRENVTTPFLKKFSAWGIVKKLAEKRAVRELVASLDIKTPSIEQEVAFLSGGNQQKTILARWLSSSLRVVILDEPTKGIDVATKVQIYRTINRLAREGVGIILISSDLPEVMNMSDRIIVFHEGTIRKEFSRDEATPAKVLAAAVGIGE